MRISGKKHTKHLCIEKDVANAASTASYTMLTVTLCRSECCVPSGLDFEAAGESVVRLFCVQLFFSRALSHCKNMTWELFRG